MRQPTPVSLRRRPASAYLRHPARYSALASCLQQGAGLQHRRHRPTASHLRVLHRRGSATSHVVWAGDASATLGRRLAHAGLYAAEVNVPCRHSSVRLPDDHSGPGVPIRELTANDDDTVYLETLFNGYGLSAEAASPQQTMMAIEHRSPHLRRYLAYIDGQPAAAATLCTGSGAPTSPAPRRSQPCATNGSQSALIRQRLHDAAVVAHQIVVTTAFGSPGQANLQRRGLSIGVPAPSAVP